MALDIVCSLAMSAVSFNINVNFAWVRGKGFGKINLMQ